MTRRVAGRHHGRGRPEAARGRPRASAPQGGPAMAAAADPDPGTTRIDEIADGIFRLCTPVPPSAFPGGFTFNQYLVLDDEPLLFHTGHRRLFPAVSAAVARVMPLERLRHVSFSHFEADECGRSEEHTSELQSRQY